MLKKGSGKWVVGSRMKNQISTKNTAPFSLLAG